MQGRLMFRKGRFRDGNRTPVNTGLASSRFVVPLRRITIVTRFLLGVTERPLCRALGYYRCDAPKYRIGGKTGPALSRFVGPLAGAQKAADIRSERAARMFRIKSRTAKDFVAAFRWT